MFFGYLRLCVELDCGLCVEPDVGLCGLEYDGGLCVKSDGGLEYDGGLRVAADVGLCVEPDVGLCGLEYDGGLRVDADAGLCACFVFDDISGFLWDNFTLNLRFGLDDFLMMLLVLVVHILYLYL